MGASRVTNREIAALLEDGPHSEAELAGWLGVTVRVLAARLNRMGVPRCARCKRRVLRAALTAHRFCSRACDKWTPTPEADKSPALMSAVVEYEVVWDGSRGSLPGLEDVPGLNSSLSGLQFRTVK